MLLKQNPKGAAALGRLQNFYGIPAPYDTTKKQVGWGNRNLLNNLRSNVKTDHSSGIKEDFKKAGRINNLLMLLNVTKIMTGLRKYGD